MNFKNKIPPFKIVLEPMNEEAKSLPKFKWANKNIGSRHQLGGEASFIQSSEYPDCQSCSKKMVFYAQLDSLNDDFIIADCGMIYIFICFDCNETKSFIQSY